MPTYLFDIISLALILCGLAAYRKASPPFFRGVVLFSLAWASVFLFIAYRSVCYFAGDGMIEAILYHLRYGVGGSGYMEYWQLIGFGTTIALLGGVGLAYWLFFRPRAADRKLHCLSAVALLIGSLILNPASVDLYVYFQKTQQPVDPNEFYAYYQTPSLRPLTKRPKNLVFIYAESLERTYFNEKIFPGLMDELRRIEARSVTFTNISEGNCTGWTVAGMTGSLLGVPLYTPSGGNSMGGMDRFMSGAIGLGDLLRAQGYHLTYMGGANLKFAGKGELFRSHGFTEVLGRDELKAKVVDPSYCTDWGWYDDTLLDLDFQRFMELSQAGKPFGLFTLTFDTHHPNGHLSKSVKTMKYGDGKNAMLNAVAGSQHLIARFIDRILASPYADQTLIVLASDHLAMPNSASKLLGRAERRNLLLILDPTSKRSRQIDTQGTTFDIGPTIMPFLGFDCQLGLGRNLLLDPKQAEADSAYIKSRVSDWRWPVMKLWEFPQLERSLTINPADQLVHIDDRSFHIPVVIKIDANMRTLPQFAFDGNAPQEHVLENMVANVDKEQYYLYIEKKPNAKRSDGSTGDSGFFLRVGKGNQEYERKVLTDNVTYSAQTIRSMLKMPPLITARQILNDTGGIRLR